MVFAMEAVKAGRHGVNEAARMCGLPSTTLKDRLRRGWFTEQALFQGHF